MTLDPTQAEPDSDVYAVFVDKVVSVTPISLDMTSRVDINALQQHAERLLSWNRVTLPLTNKGLLAVGAVRGFFGLQASLSY
ncbi:MAG UNVERIFIED_CONTAM: hypothetical protein LVT10_21140 [Anaerolineae bacterium]|jgi:hypothetical protein